MNPLIMSVLERTIAAGTPLLLGTLGEVLAERAGILNLGVEGMMSVGAVSGFMAALSLLHAFTSITLKVNQVVSGLALAMLGVGLSGLLGKPYMGVPLPTQLPAVKIPWLADIPVVGTILFDKDPLFYFAVVLGLVLWFLLSRTRWGVRVRSVGENPAAAAVQGVSVSGMRYLCTLAGGALAGLGGAHLSLVYSKSWTEGMTGGRGWIVIALTIFALWNPLRAFVGAFLFGGIFVLQYLLQPLGIPPNLLGMMPYLATLVVLLIGGLNRSRRHQDAPAALGEPFTRGER
jgi:ABC-type uncharacterized transport system permease subunit